MKSIIIAFLVILNVFAIIFNWKMMKGYENSKKIILIVIGEALMFAIVNIIYGISANNIPQEIHEYSKSWINLTFLAINMIVMYSSIVKQINRKTFEEIDEKTFKRKIMIWAIVSLIIIIVECIYMKNIQLGILDMLK